jgi:hypothetical protein
MLKIIKTLFVFFTLISIVCISCKKEASNKTTTSASGTNWQFGNNVYTGHSSVQNSSPFNGNATTLITASTSSATGGGDGGNYGAYSGSAITMNFNSNLGVGKYTVADLSIVTINPGIKYMNISCAIGTAESAGSLNYILSGNSGKTADVTLDANGKYHVTLTNPVTLIKNGVLGNGIPGAADTYNLTINDAY